MTMHERDIQQPGAKWYVVQALSPSEFQAERDLADLGFEAWCPRHRVHVTLRGKRKLRTRPLIRGYLFVRCVMVPEAFHAILGAKAVMDVMRGVGGFAPQAVSDGAVRVLRLVEADADRKKPFGPGDFIVISDGIMAGQRAEILELDGKRRLKVRLTELGASRAFSISREAVEKVTAATA